MKRILFATNFSDSCSNAFQYVKEMIGKETVKVDLVHIYQVAPTTLGIIPVDALNSMILEKRENVYNQLIELRNELVPDQRGDVFPVYGVYPSSDIAELAENQEVDFIVMALRQKYSLIDRMIGTITAYTIKLAKVPILAIPSGAKYSPIKEILFPTAMHFTDELTEQEKQALEWLSMFSKFFENANIHFVHIKAKSQGVDVVYMDQPYPTFDFTVSYADTVEDGIMDNLKKSKADMITFFKPHRSFWERLYHSSVTRKVLYHSRLPLLIF